jgi:hypothetical protein
MDKATEHPDWKRSRIPWQADTWEQLKTWAIGYAWGRVDQGHDAIDSEEFANAYADAYMDFRAEKRLHMHSIQGAFEKWVTDDEI